MRAGYDRLGERYLEWGARVEGGPRDRHLREVMGRLDGGARVLDLGCGPGLPSTRILARRFDVVGVDISEAQLRLAKRNVPGAALILGDFSQLSFPDGTFDGVVALYSIPHLPREEHAELLRRVARWLRPGGLFLASLGSGDGPDWTGQWLGVPMFFSSYDAETNRRLLRRAGFDLLLDEVVEEREPEGTVAFLWVLARKRHGSALRDGSRGGKRGGPPRIE